MTDPGLQAVRDKMLLLKRGSQAGPTLSLVKQFIRAEGGQNLELDLLPTGGTGGPFGPETEAAVKIFQRRSHLDAGGIVGPKTMRRMDDLMGIFWPPRRTSGDRRRNARSHGSRRRRRLGHDWAKAKAGRQTRTPNPEVAEHSARRILREHPMGEAPTHALGPRRGRGQRRPPASSSKSVGPVAVAYDDDGALP